MAKHRKRHRKHHYLAKNRHRAHRRRHRVHNPLSIPGIPRDFSAMLVPAAIGGLGAVGVDVTLAYAGSYLPATFASGWGRIALQVAAALGLGYVAGMATNKRDGQLVAAGALTVTAYSAIRQILAPTLGTTIKGLSGLADFSDYRATWSGENAVGGNPAIGAYMRQGAYMPQGRVGAYMQNQGFGRLGYMNPGSVLTGLRQKQMAAFGGFSGASDDMF